MCERKSLRVTKLAISVFPGTRFEDEEFFSSIT